MKTLQWLVAGIVIGIIAAAFRDFERGEWLAPAIPRGSEEPDAEEPVLGYDGMDQETILEWIEEAELDAPTVTRLIRYEEATRAREPVLDALGELLA
jgi:hypothetical protein